MNIIHLLALWTHKWKNAPPKEGECWLSIGQSCLQRQEMWKPGSQLGCGAHEEELIYVCVATGARCWRRQLKNVSSCFSDLWRWVLLVGPLIHSNERSVSHWYTNCGKPSYESGFLSRHSFRSTIPPPMALRMAWAAQESHLSVVSSWEDVNVDSEAEDTQRLL